MFLCPISIVVGFSWSMAINAFALPGNIALTPMLHRRFSLTLNQHIFDPPASWASWRAVYHRMVELKDGSLLSSWENYSPEPPLIAAPIWKSDDGGRTFHNFSQVTDQVDNWGMRYQPFLFVRPRPFAGFKTGDILFAGNSVPADLSGSKIDLYFSKDGGATWEFVSSIATGGTAIASNGNGAIWEPFLYLHGNELICYYSDQGDPDHGQKLVHKTTTDLLDWSKSVDDVAYSDFTAHPGMTVMTKTRGSNYILLFEYCDGPIHCQVNAKVANDPTRFADATPYPITTADGLIVSGSPYIIWVDKGGGNGTLIANGNSDPALWINTDLGLPSTAWRRIEVGADQAHSRCLELLSNNDSLLIGGAGSFEIGTYANNVTFSIVSLKAHGIS